MLVRRVEPGQQLVADDQEARFISAALERLLGRLLSVCVEVVGAQFGANGLDVCILARLVVLLALGEDTRDHPLGLRRSIRIGHAVLRQISGDHPSQSQPVEHDRLAVDGDDLRFEAIRAAGLFEVLPDVARDQSDALRVLGDQSEADPLLLQLLALLVGQIDEPAVEQDVDLGLVDRPFGLPALGAE